MVFACYGPPSIDVSSHCTRWSGAKSDCLSNSAVFRPINTSSVLSSVVWTIYTLRVRPPLMGVFLQSRHAETP